jgi:hypothetical protein
MAGETEVKMMLEVEEKALKALIMLLKDSGKFLESFFKAESNAIDNIFNKVRDVKENRGGEIKHKDLLSVARKEHDNLLIQNNIPKQNVPQIMEKAKQYGIPIAVIGGKEDTANVKLSFRMSDKDIFEQITKEIVEEKLKKRPDELSSFKIKKWELKALKSELDRQNIAMDIIKDKQSEIYCVYENKNKSAVETVKSNLKKSHSEIVNDFQIKEQDGFYLLQDLKLGKQISMNTVLEYGENELIDKISEKFGYDKTKATLAVGAFAETLTPDKQVEFFTDNPEKILNTASEIRLENENVLLQNYSYYQINMKEDGLNRFAVSDNNGNISMLSDDVKKNKQILNDMGVTDEQTVEAILEKHEIVKQIYSDKDKELSEIAVKGKKNEGKIQLQRNDKDNFTVKMNDFEKTFSFSDKQKAVNIMSMTLILKYGISETEALKTAKTAVSNSQNLSFYKIADNTPKVTMPDFVVNRENADRFTITLGEISKDFNINIKEEVVKQIQSEFNVTPEKASELYDTATNNIRLDVYDINRKIGGNFEISCGENKREYSFSNKDESIKAMQEDFGITAENAVIMFGKAEEQNVLEEQVALENVEVIGVEIEQPDFPINEIPYIPESHEYDIEPPDFPINEIPYIPESYEYEIDFDN